MASLYNINRTVEAYDIRTIDPADGQLKSLVDIPSIGGGGDSYTQAQIDGFLANKADTSYVVGNFYTQTQVDTSLTSKANQATTYTKTEVDTSLASKANQATTYTKTEVDTAVNDKVSLTGTDQTMTGKLTATTFATNTFNSNGANDITFQRNSVEYCKLKEDGTVRLLEFPTNGGVSANQLYGNYFKNRSYGWDTIFEGSNTTSDGRVEYMKYDFTNEVLQLPKKVLVNGGDGKTEIYESTEATNNVFRIWNKETTNTPVIHLGAGATSNDMVLSSGGFTFNKSVDCANGLSVGDNLTLAYNKKLQWGVNYIIERISPTNPTFSFVAPTNSCSHKFIVGNVLNDAQKILTINNSEVLAKRTLKSNNFDSENNSDLVIKRNGVEYMRLDQSADEVVISKKIRLSGGEGKMVIYESTEASNNVVRLW